MSASNRKFADVSHRMLLDLLAGWASYANANAAHCGTGDAASALAEVDAIETAYQLAGSADDMDAQAVRAFLISHVIQIFDAPPAASAPPMAIVRAPLPPRSARIARKRGGCLQ